MRSGIVAKRDLGVYKLFLKKKAHIYKSVSFFKFKLYGEPGWKCDEKQLLSVWCSPIVHFRRRNTLYVVGIQRDIGNNGNHEMIMINGVQYELTRLSNAGVNLSYRGESRAKGEVIFAKCTSLAGAENMLSVCRLAAKIGVDEVPRLIDNKNGVTNYNGKTYICTEWREGKHIQVEDMNEHQFNALCKTYLKISELLNHLDISVVARDCAPDEYYNVLLDYYKQHPIAGWWLKSFLSVPKAERSLNGHKLSVIHNDFHPANYCFQGDIVTSVYDFDSLATGLPCEDILRTFVDSLREEHIRFGKRKYIISLLRKAIRELPWTTSDWTIALNSCRLYWAAKHLPPSKTAKWYSAFEIYWKDRLLRRLFGIINER